MTIKTSSMSVNTIMGPFDENDYLKFRKIYRQTIKKEAGSFKFRGQEYEIEFAKYLLEYLELDPLIKSVMSEPDPDD